MQIRVVESAEYPVENQILQRKLLVNLDVKEVEKTDVDGEVSKSYIYQQIVSNIGSDVEQVKAEYYYNKMQKRLSSDGEIEVNLNYINDEDSRAVGTVGDWICYRKACRDVATKDDGVFAINDISGNTYTYKGDAYNVILDSDGFPLPPTK